MTTIELHQALRRLFSELVDGATEPRGAFILNSGDPGLLRSLDRLDAARASRSAQDGATIAAHAQHLRYGLMLMNRWASEGGDPFADATWDAAWQWSDVNEQQWDEIRRGLQDEAHRWRDALSLPRSLTTRELTGMIGSIAHLAYHLGAIRQVERSARGPTEGTFG